MKIEINRNKDQSFGTVSTKYEEINTKFNDNNLNNNNSINDDKKFVNNLSNFYNFFDISNFNKKVINSK